MSFHIKLLPLFLFIYIAGYCQDNYLSQGIRAFQNEEYDKSIGFFTKAIEENPSLAHAYYWRAAVSYYHQPNKMKVALEDVTKSISFFGKKEKEMKARAFRLRGSIYEYLNNGQNALEDYNKAILLYPKKADGYIDRGLFYLENGEALKALADFEIAKKTEPANEKALLGIGRAYHQLAQFDRAEKVFNELVLLDANNAKAFYYRGINAYELKKQEDAIRDVFSAYRLDDDYYSSFVNIASKNIPFALALVNRSLLEETGASKRAFYFLRAELFKLNYQFAEAISDLNLLMDLSDEDEKLTLISKKATIYYYAGAYDMAIDAFGTIIESDSLFSTAYGWRALCKQLIGKHKEAENDLSKAITIKPEESWFYSYRGEIRSLFLNDKRGALNDLHMAYSLNKSSYSSLLSKGKIYLTTPNEEEKAKKDFQTILEADSADVPVYLRAKALFYTGRKNEAKNLMSRFIDKNPRALDFYQAAAFSSLINESALALQQLEKGFEEGFYQLESVDQNPDFESIRQLPALDTLLRKYRQRRSELIRRLLPTIPSSDSSLQKTATISMQPKGSGTYEVSCKINGLPLNMIFDTGASDISISQTEVQFMLKNGYLDKSDFIGSQKYIDANGDISVGATILFRTVDFGGLILKNIKASVVNNKNAPLLFGQSARCAISASRFLS